MKRLAFTIAIIGAVVATSTVADARPRHRHHAHSNVGEPGQPAQCQGIPWCGCWLRLQKGITDTAYNLASHWHRYGQRVAMQVGAIARLNHHVGIVVGVDGKNPVIKSGNHRGRVATATYPAHRVIEYRM